MYILRSQSKFHMKVITITKICPSSGFASMPCSAFCLKLPQQLPCISQFTFGQPCVFPANHVFRSRYGCSLAEYLSDFPLLLRITSSLSRLNSWADSSTGGRAARDGCIMEFGLDTYRLRGSAVGLGVEILFRDRKYGTCRISDGRSTSCISNAAFHTHLACRQLYLA